MLTASETRIPIGVWTDLIINKKVSIRELINSIYDKIGQYDDYNIWIHLVPKEVILKRIDLLESNISNKELPLYCIPFAVKDNIDVAGIPTTAACPAFSYVPDKTANAVQLLEDAGGLMIGKTNLDQFATGLVGTRSPYGAVKNSFNPSYISGGSSSGSAVAVALGMVCFSLGTDTAGSGRVPAGFNNLIGLKPSKDLISTVGLVPACKSLDCISIFASQIDDAEFVLQLLQSDKKSEKQFNFNNQKFTFAIPSKSYLKFFDNEEYEMLFYRPLKSCSLSEENW